MSLPLHVRQKPVSWRYIPWLSGSANTIYPYIYLPRTTYRDLSSDNPSYYSRATLAHEEVHLKRQKEVGLVRYALLYIFSRRFRFSEELLAIKAQMTLLRSSGMPFDIAERARKLASWEYLWCAPHSRAEQRLLEMWENDI